MKKIIDSWILGLQCLLFDDLISYYAFFTIVFTECFYLFTFHEHTLAIKLSMILLGYVAVVLIVAAFKYSTNINGYDKFLSITYLIAFIVLCVLGCTVSWKLCLPLTVIPLISTFTCIVLREVQDSFERFKKIIYNKIVEGTLLFITVGIPFILFCVFLCIIPAIPLSIKIFVPIIYMALSPFIAYIEDSWACNNIFELFFE